MIDHKIALTAIALVVTITAKRSPVEICEDLIIKDTMFENGYSNRINNFMYGYRHLSLDQIDGEFNFRILQGDTSKNAQRMKELQHDLITEYFLDLFYRHRLGNYIHTLDYPEKWCKEKANDVLAELSGITNYPGTLSEQEENCINFTRNKLFSETDTKSQLKLYRILYENWSYAKLRPNDAYNLPESYHHIFLASETVYYTESYSLGFFAYYEKALDLFENYPNVDDEFRSVEKFCIERGYILVKRSKYRDIGN